LPEGELGEKLQEEFDEGKELLVTVVSAMGEEHALTCKYQKKILDKPKKFSMIIFTHTLHNSFTDKEAPKQ
jgi:hypothetical protein